MHDRLRMQPGGASAEKLGDLLAEPRAAARRRDHERAFDFSRTASSATRSSAPEAKTTRCGGTSWVKATSLHFPSRQMPSAFCAGRSEIENSTDSLDALWG